MSAERSKAAWRDRYDAGRAILAFCCLGAVIAFSTLVDTRAGRSRVVTAPAPPSDEEIYTGSILFVPYEGNVCRQNLLDNLTGQIRENGIVACDAALAQSTDKSGRNWSAARVDAIRDGFSRR